MLTDFTDSISFLFEGWGIFYSINPCDENNIFLFLDSFEHWTEKQYTLC